MNTVKSLPTVCKSILGLRLFYCNARSVLANFDELCVLCNVYNYHVISIAESWLCDSILNTEISLPGYTIFRRDRDRYGGGVLIFIKTELCPSAVTFNTSLANRISSYCFYIL